MLKHIGLKKQYSKSIGLLIVCLLLISNVVIVVYAGSHWEYESTSWDVLNENSRIGYSNNDCLVYVNGFWYAFYKDTANDYLYYKWSSSGVSWSNQITLYDSYPVGQYDVSGFDYTNTTEYLVLAFINVRSGVYYLNIYVYDCTDSGTLSLVRQNDEKQGCGSFAFDGLSLDWTPNYDGDDGYLIVGYSFYDTDWNYRFLNSSNLGVSYSVLFTDNHVDCQERYIHPFTVVDEYSDRSCVMFPDYTSTHDLYYAVKGVGGIYPSPYLKTLSLASEYDFPIDEVKRDKFDGLGFVNGSSTRDLYVFYCWVDADDDLNFQVRWSTGSNSSTDFTGGNNPVELVDGASNAVKSCTISRRFDNNQLDVFYRQGGNVKRISSTDDGETWGSVQNVGTGGFDTVFGISSIRRGYGFGSTYDVGGVLSLSDNVDVYEFLGWDFPEAPPTYQPTFVDLYATHAIGLLGIIGMIYSPLHAIKKYNDRESWFDVVYALGWDLGIFLISFCVFYWWLHT
jgi:hypothetical protein